MFCRIDGILEDPQVAHLRRQILGIRRTVAALDADEHEETAADAPYFAIGDRDSGRQYTLNDGPHGDSAAVATINAETAETADH